MLLDSGRIVTSARRQRVGTPARDHRPRTSVSRSQQFSSGKESVPEPGTLTIGSASSCLGWLGKRRRFAG
jgi:hypothetical protein